ncbi:MAG TPA: helix-turn-helix transcriptional regulator [bacterium]|nr:helix-turn-helix transcriptional regulator [bacterium]
MTRLVKDRQLLSRLKEYRENNLISKTELARKAEISLVTLDRIEKGYACRMATKRKILQALGIDIPGTDPLSPEEDR